MSTIAIPPAGQPALTPGHYYLIDLQDFMEDGTDLDGAEPVTVTQTFPSVMTASLANPRQLKVTALTIGAASASVSAPGVPQNTVLTVNVSVTAAPNLSHIEAGVITGPFPV